MLSDRSSPSALPVGQLSGLQYMLLVTARLKGTPTCLLIYIVLILLNVVVMAYEYNGGSTRHWLAILLESIINLVLTLEVLTSILQQRWSYFHHSVNLIDLVLTLLCLLFFVLFLVNPPSATDDHYSEIDIAILITRYLFQLTRISVLIYRGRKTTDALTQDDIDFTVHEMRDRIDAELGHAADTGRNGGGAGGGRAKAGGKAGVSAQGKSQAQLEKQQLLRGAGEDDLSQGADEQWRRKDDSALDALELQLKRAHSQADEEDVVEQEEERKVERGKPAVVALGRQAVTAGPVKRALSPGNREGGAGGVDRKGGGSGMGTSVSDLTLSRSARRLKEEEEDEDVLAEDDVV